MLLLVIVENGLLILALISFMVLGPVVPCILVGLLLSNVVLFTGAEIAGDNNDIVHGSCGLKLIIDGLVLIVLV